jgi:hypothetical protein
MNEGKIYSCMMAIMRDIEAIGKDEENRAQGFKFRGIDTVMSHLNPVFKRHGVFIAPEVLDREYMERPTKSGGMMLHTWLRVKFSFYADDGSSVSMIGIGEAADSGDKSCNKAMSISLRYCLTQTFLIPTSDEKDPDADSPQFGGRGKQRAPKSPYNAEQERVMAEKLTQQRASSMGPTPPPPAAPRATTTDFRMLEAFSAMKAAIGEDTYREILRNNGFEKSNQITSKEDGKRIYNQMAERKKEIESQKDLRTPIRVKDWPDPNDHPLGQRIELDGKVYTQNKDLTAWVKAEG